MREIKFRGKGIHSDEWCFGSLVNYGDGECEIQGFDVFHEGKDKWQEITVDYNTVGQFTGMYDANGKEIYEGDIVAGLEYPDFITGCDGEVNALVTWDADSASFILDAGCRVNIRPCASIRRRIRVIGDTFDNPGLMKGGKQ